MLTIRQSLMCDGIMRPILLKVEELAAFGDNEATQANTERGAKLVGELLTLLWRAGGAGAMDDDEDGEEMLGVGFCLP